MTLEDIARAREAVCELRDAAREGRVIDFRKRDPLVLAIHAIIDHCERMDAATRANEDADLCLECCDGPHKCGCTCHRTRIGKKS